MEERITLTYNGKQYLNFTVESLRAANVPQDVINAELERLKRVTQRTELRADIQKNVGDVESNIGVLSDISSLLTAIALADTVALSTSSDFATYKKKKIDTLKALSGGVDLAALSQDALTKIQKGEVVLTASVKGVGNVLQDAFGRSTAAATILARSAAGGTEKPKEG